MFRDFPPRSIPTSQAFQDVFLERWDDNKIQLQVLSQYKNLKKGGFEFFHEFSSRFMRVYNSIPVDIKPLVGAAKLHYVDAFESEFFYYLERGNNPIFLTCLNIH